MLLAKLLLEQVPLRRVLLSNYCNVVETQFEDGCEQLHEQLHEQPLGLSRSQNIRHCGPHEIHFSLVDIAQA